MVLSDEGRFEFNNSAYCWIWKSSINNDKVRDHCHLTGKYRGAAHYICNLQFKKPKFIPVIFLKNSETFVLTIMRLTLPSISPMIEKGIRGGISVIWNHFGGAINLYMGEAYDVTKLTKYITYPDTNNLYGWAMCQNVPASSCQRFQVDDYIRQLEKYSLHSCGRSWISKRAPWLA